MGCGAEDPAMADGAVDAEVGLDAGVADAGASERDGGSGDAGSDGGAIDAAAMDASAGDAGDAASSDAGVAACTPPGFVGGSTRLTRGQLDEAVPLTFVAGGSVYAIQTVFPRTWQRWTGTAWSSESVPSALAGPQLVGSATTINDTTLFMVQSGFDRSLVRFDGAAASTITLPPELQDVVAFTESLSGDVFAITRDRTGASLHVYRAGAWDAPVAAPPVRGDVDDTAIAALADGSLVLAWTSGQELNVSRRPSGGAWSTPQRVNPSWRVDAHGPRLHAPASGGLVLGATGYSATYTVPTVFLSSDGVTFSAGEEIGSLTAGGPIRSVYASDCFEAPMVSTATGAWSRQATDDWRQIGSTSRPSSVPVGSGHAVALGDHAFWIWGEGRAPDVTFTLRQ